MNPNFADRLEEIYARLRAGLKAKTRDYDWRMAQLRQLKRLLQENEDQIAQALWTDLRKGKFECQATEQGVLAAEIDDTLKHLKRWMKIKRVRTPFYNWPGRSYITRDPYGLTLVMGAWNYPFQLTMAPVIGAIAGGNACLIKPPDLAPATSKLIANLVPKYLDADLFAVIEGGKDEVTEILKKKFDLIFFTGGGAVGQVILTAAAPHLTPVVLELGGKSPAVVMKDADIAVTARRLTWGKFMNAGQTCVAPDYVIVHPEIREKLVEALKRTVREFYGDDVQKSPDYCRIVNERAFDRVIKLTEGTKVLFGGTSDRKDLYIEPTVVLADASSEADVMKHEIFGPILPIVEMADPRTIRDFINGRPKPLALYLFTHDAAEKRKFMTETSSGSFVINDVVVQLPEPELPFGGVGASGMGSYHGRFSFETFTHAKGVLHKTFALDAPVRYAPYTAFKAKAMRWLFG